MGHPTGLSGDRHAHPYRADACSWQMLRQHRRVLAAVMSGDPFSYKTSCVKPHPVAPDGDVSRINCTITLFS